MARSAGPADGSPAASPANGSPADGSPAAPPTTADFDYDLAPHAIAQTPAEPRDSARLLVDLDDESEPQHRLVSDLPELLGPGDLLVVNTTRVIPARLRLEKPTGGAAEVLLLEPLPAPHDAPPAPGWWSALV
ncbi:MAG TPA: tRNA preQ1(34) S-adenosylmethionine ribosyltransferase-isomerase QueA, partial [Acidimicrobiaceae bacterium]|nr:tRNA preQ1(34) S-adenosylmethionine ribosyltransferase-isomerase QueA [Acidimicrobiaceae bacterium]